MLTAVGLIVGALFLRRNVIDDDDVVVGQGTEPPAADVSELVCITELAGVCDAIGAARSELDVTVEDGLVTLDRLAALDDGVTPPLWLTVQPFPTMLDELRTFEGGHPLGLGGDALAATPLGIAAPTGRFEVLSAACADARTWRCLGDGAGRQWSELDGDESWKTVRPAVGKADRSAVALASFAAAVAGYLGTPTYTRSSWDADPDFTSWVRRLRRTVPYTSLSGTTPLATMVQRSSAIDMAATTRAELEALGTAAERFEAKYPEPAMWLEVVLAAPAEAEPGALTDAATTALTDAGWSSPGDVTAAVPSATTMLALRTLWQEAR